MKYIFSDLISGCVWKRFRMLELGRLRLRGMDRLKDLQDESTSLPCTRPAVALRCPADPPRQYVFLLIMLTMDWLARCSNKDVRGQNNGLNRIAILAT